MKIILTALLLLASSSSAHAAEAEQNPCQNELRAMMQACGPPNMSCFGSCTHSLLDPPTPISTDDEKHGMCKCGYDCSAGNEECRDAMIPAIECELKKICEGDDDCDAVVDAERLVCTEDAVREWLQRDMSRDA
mmetsp:Transcript_1313/g.2263  ORF Transcript_1313/g.2263 Transcript_1313/m.2263 type:complete len:134 (-) Transcript_1313:185-586(-)